MTIRNDRLRRLVAVFLTLVITLTACAPSLLNRTPPTPAIPPGLPKSTQEQLSDYNLVVQAIQTKYLDSNLSGTTWQAAVTTYRDRILQGVDNTRFFDALDGLLSSLHDDDLVVIRPVTSTSPSASSNVSGTFSGIGVQVALPEPNKNRILVLKVYAGSPAEGAGIQAHDSILRVDGQPVKYTDRNNVLSRVRGPSGSQVTLTIHTPGKANRDVIVTRAPITTTSQSIVERLPNTNLAYILPDLTDAEATPLDIAQGLRDLSNPQEPDGLILDLRTIQNGNFPFTGLLELFVNGHVGTLYTRSGKTPIQITGKNIAGSQIIPMVVLVSDQTRGEAESFAGILQDLGRAKIIGNRTPGSAPILLPVSLPNTGAQVLIPAGDIRGVKNVSWYKHGIQPDIVSNQDWETYTNQNDPILTTAEQALTR